MKILNLKQNSSDWYEHRKNYINASEIASIMGLNPFENKESLFRRKLFGEKIEDNAAMRHGRLLESEARIFFNEINQTNFVPKVFVREFFSASLDGWNESSSSILEIKCPINCNSLTWKKFFLKNEIPMYYYSQIQAQIYCSGAQKAFFLVYQTYQNARVKEILKNNFFIEEMYQKCSIFYNLFQKAKQILDELKK